MKIAFASFCHIEVATFCRVQSLEEEKIKQEHFDLGRNHL